jgi:predicted amidohydrolase YtcJ
MGSDWNVSTANPFELIHVAVNRHHPDGRNGAFYPDQRLTLDQALTAATMGSAYVNHLDSTTGSITPGKLADSPSSTARSPASADEPSTVTSP